MQDTRPIIYWFRRDFRLTDHPGLSDAVRSRRPVIPLFILDPEFEGLGAAAKWRLGRAIEALRVTLAAAGSGLVLRRGDALDVLRAVIRESGAGGVGWTRGYTPRVIERDRRVKVELAQAGIEVESYPGFLVREPWEVSTKAGQPYKVFTPYYREWSAGDAGACVEPVRELRAPETWPSSDDLNDWKLGAGVGRGADNLSRHTRAGEDAALERLHAFLAGPVEGYGGGRDRLDRDGTSMLSDHLAYGEISARYVRQAALDAARSGGAGTGAFVRQLAWRDFAWHLAFHTPQILSENWREGWDAFPWRQDNADAECWRRGMTGEQVVDAAMRQMWVSGRMHNRGRMIVASYLTKHLLTHWRVGCDWFAECLTDWDEASNAMGWQWVAGSGPDAAPFFRIFNPSLQAERFDPDGDFRRCYLAEIPGGKPGKDALNFFEGVPGRWGLEPDQRYPEPVVDPRAGRRRALDAYGQFQVAKGRSALGFAHAPSHTRPV